MAGGIGYRVEAQRNSDGTYYLSLQQYGDFPECYEQANRSRTLYGPVPLLMVPAVSRLLLNMVRELFADVTAELRNPTEPYFAGLGKPKSE